MPIAYGLGCAVYRGGWLGHSGAGATQACVMRAHPQRQLVVAVGIDAPLPRLREAVSVALLNALGAGFEGSSQESAQPVRMKAEEVLGMYAGGVTELSANVVPCEGGVSCELIDNAASSTVRLTLKPNQDGVLVPADRDDTSLGFFIESRSGTPCLMAGITAYRRT